VTDSRNRVTTTTYDVVNRMATKTLPNGVRTVYSYDDLDRIINLTYTKANGTVLVSETYTRNAGGEPSKVLREDGSYTLYEYDAALRLSKEVVYNPAGGLVESIEYSYDLDGKRTKKVDAAGTHNYNYNANGQLATVGQDGYVYDADGRLSQFNRESKTVVLSHDAIDHLTQISINGVNTQYLYDAQGNRIGEVSGGNTKNYLVAPNLSNGLESTDLVTDGNGNVVSDYVYGGSSIIARLDSNGEPIYYLMDSMGSVIGLVDGSGDRVSRIIYDGFGEVKSGDDGTSLGGDFRFQGQWLETESGLYYMRARDYDVKTGLFLSRDAVDVQEQSVEAFNPYQFTFNNPLIFSDPLGTFSITEISATINIENTLNSLKQYSYAQAKETIKNKLFEGIGNIALNAFKAVLPVETDISALQAATGLATKGGSLLELSLKRELCKLIPDIAPGNIFFEPGVKADGNIGYSGYQCPKISDAPTQRPPIFGTKSVARPDFIVTPSGNRPRSSDLSGNNPKPLTGPGRSWLVGDIKLSLKTAVNDYIHSPNVKGSGGKKYQWDAMVSYAKRNGYRVVGITTLFGEGAQKDTYIKKMAELALAEAKDPIILLIAILLENKSSPF
jgi:RHS repeat-associated protein